MTKEERSFYRSQAQKRLKLAYEYAREDIESGSFRDVYLLSGGIAKVEFILFFTEPEERMWHDIRAWQGDFCFFPEYPIGPDTVDFADPFRKVVIEVDSRYHTGSSDSLKNERLTQAGYKVIRVDHSYTKKNLDDLYEQIELLRDLGKQKLADKIESDLPGNSEGIVKSLPLDPKPNRPEDVGRLISIQDVAKTKEFKRYKDRYYDNIPESLLERIQKIPLER